MDFIDSYKVAQEKVLIKYFAEFPQVKLGKFTIQAFSVSHKMSKVKNLIKQLPSSEIKNKPYSACIASLNEYLENYLIITQIIDLIKNWKDCSIELNNKQISFSELKYVNDFFINSMPKDIKVRSKVSISDDYCIESTPYKYVYYPSGRGSFIAFSQDAKEWCLCSCCEKAVSNLKEMFSGKSENYNSLLRQSHFFGLSKIMDLNQPITFKDNLCHVCNNKIPTSDYCHKMYGTYFVIKYGWYIRKRYLELGINDLEYLPSCPEEYKKIINQKNEFTGQQPEIANEKQRKLSLELFRKIENEMRKELGFPLIGEKFFGETQLFNAVKNLFPNLEILRHYRPEWLQYLELDIFIPNLKVGLEYQGQQHYEPIKTWGGKSKLLVQQEHDSRKKELCKKTGVKLIEIRYDETYDEEYLKKLIISDEMK